MEWAVLRSWSRQTSGRPIWDVAYGAEAIVISTTHRLKSGDSSYEGKARTRRTALRVPFFFDEPQTFGIYFFGVGK